MKEDFGDGGRPSEEDARDVWSPPESPLERTHKPRRYLTTATIEGIVIGLLLGVVDIHHSGAGDRPLDVMVMVYFGVGLLLGLRHERHSWPCWLPLGIGLYVVHLAAIARGYLPPFLESSPERAIGCFFVLFPSLVGLSIGAFVRYLLGALGWVDHPG
jgi:hypothetical protein